MFLLYICLFLCFIHCNSEDVIGIGIGIGSGSGIGIDKFNSDTNPNPIRIIQDPDDEIIKSDPLKHKKAQKIINFASESAGATVLATSDECSGFSSVLTDDKDKYAMCPCSAKKKHVTIGLSEDVSIILLIYYNIYIPPSTPITHTPTHSIYSYSLLR